MSPIAFLAPLALASVALVAGPILVHMLRRAKTRQLEFPSMRFLRETPILARALAAPDRWLLLVLRALFVAFVALAFARPVLVGGADPATTMVVLLDASASMRRPEARDAALAEARRIVEGLGPADRVRVGAFDTAIAWLAEAGDARAALGALERYEPGFGRAVPAEPFAEASRYLVDQPEATRRLVVVSDFQRSNGPWSPSGVDSSVAMEARQVGGPFDTRYVDGVAVRGERAAVGVVHADADATTLESIDVDLAPGAASAAVRFEPIEGGWRASVTGADGFDADDATYVAGPPSGDVAVVEPGPARPYLAAAVGAATASARPAERVDAPSLDAAGRAVMTNRALAGSPAVDALEAWARGGGEAVVFAVGPAEWRFPGVEASAAPAAGLVRVAPADTRSALDDALLRADVAEARAVAVSDGDVVLLRGADGRPLAVRRAVGSGGVTVVGFDPTPAAAPLVRSAVFPALLGFLLDPGAPHGAEVGDRVAGHEGAAREPGLVRAGPTWTAVNVPRAESEPALLDGASVAALGRAASPASSPSALAEVERRQMLWWLLLVAAAGLGLAELAVALRRRPAEG